jgi:hypothetical protein
VRGGADESYSNARLRQPGSQNRRADLQTASANLRNADSEVDDVSDIVIDRDTVSATSINGPHWVEEDFDDDPGADTESEDTEKDGAECEARE